MARLKVSKAAVHGPLKHITEAGSVVSKCTIRQTLGDHLIRQSIHQVEVSERWKSNLVTDELFV